jgi:hypothetical protein
MFSTVGAQKSLARNPKRLVSAVSGAVLNRSLPLVVDKYVNN